MGSAAKLDPRHLREVLGFAVAVAREAHKRPGARIPPAIRPFLRERRVPSARLGALARAVESDPQFLGALAAGATVESVGELGYVWLTRPEGWEERVRELAAAAEQLAATTSMEERLRSAEKRREQATEARFRAEAELVVTRDQLGAAREALAARDAELAALAQQHEALGRELGQARAEARRSQQRADSLRTRLDDLQRAAESSGGDAPVEADPDAAPASVLSDVQRSALTDLTKVAGELADRLADLERQLGEPSPVAPSGRAARRVPLVRPGGVRSGTAEEADFLMRAHAVVLVDGYNVAKAAWPDLELADQRDRLIAFAENAARRFDADITVVFDGADVPGAAAERRRLVRVMYSPPGVIADDVIRAEVDRVPTSKPVVVVTEDREIIRDVKAKGASTIPSHIFATL